MDIKRHGKLVARLTPPPFGPASIRHPWEALRNSGALLADPEESVLEAQAFDALR
ncbi:hypothetical protein KQ313_02850 [Synechococcus sp. CS-1325]|uniref:hypothetical protein n=1 Tax=Synechococcus sp. CS-1325 TaxID=2847979 RepID=UPI00223B8FEB|nr:hypothetical protein [Synechococcus sp. CS-1325]MCT0198623.1 hypothetical protein [Synechococcus sp. CS-1325]MCT4365272.1 hypothetical protein [Candidatus Regnicoccus frigidus MAG-AL1]